MNLEQKKNIHLLSLVPSPASPPSHPTPYCQTSFLTTPVAHAPTGTVNVWFGSASHVTLPSAATLIYLYSTTVPGARSTVTSQRWLVLVYCDEERGMALAGVQELGGRRRVGVS